MYKSDSPSVPFPNILQNPRIHADLNNTDPIFFPKTEAKNNITSASICNMYPTRSSN